MRKILLALSAFLFSVPFLVVAPASAYTYDVVSRSDPRGDVSFNETRYKFPDAVRFTAKHEMPGTGPVLVVIYQLRRDAAWKRVDTATFDANRYHVLAYDAKGVSISRPNGTNFECRVCTVRARKAARRLVIRIPWAKLGKPSHIAFSDIYISMGLIQDHVRRPARVLY
ncbi:MAG: hypothetical protein ACRDPR_09115 [Nocardioidaceae bacterium]